MTETIDLKQYAVLFVDDEQQAGKYFKKGMDKDFRVLTATHVPEAIAILEKEWASIGVVITDQRMPGQAGVELLTQVRQRWPAIVRILITAYSDLESAMSAVNAGAVYKYITKPADFPLLRQVLIEALQLHDQTVKRDKLAQTLKELEAQRRATEAAEAQREQLQQHLLKASREAGRAEVATGILHNVGNVLNSMNVSAGMINKALQQSKVANLNKALGMLEEHRQDLASFLTSDDRGQILPGYLNKLAGVLAEEHDLIARELSSLLRSLDHIGQVVRMQQSFASVSSVFEPASPAELMDDAVRMNLTVLEGQGVSIERQYAPLEQVHLDRHKVLQILINLVSNAGKAVKGRDPEQKKIILRIEEVEEGSNVRFQVIDKGEGISAENITRIFTHGFTTRKDGHGFGLHSAANAAAEMGGSLTASSEGAGLGAIFTLDVPKAPSAIPARGEIPDQEKAAA